MKKIEKTISSMEVAEMVEKQHNELLKDIRRYVEQLGEGKIPQSDFFTESTYRNERGKEYPCYSVTKKGCEFIAHKLTGIKGTKFTAQYINRFHDMEEELNQPKSPMQLLELEFQAIKEVDSKVDAVNEDLQKFKQDMPLLAVEIEKITKSVRTKGMRLLGGKTSRAYNSNSLRQKVYSDIYREIRRQFGVETYRAIKRNQCDLVLKVIEHHELPMILTEEIVFTNAQMNMEVAV